MVYCKNREYWIERGIIIFLRDLFDDKGKLYTYEELLNVKSFPVMEYVSVIKVIPSGIIELMKCHLNYQNVAVQRNCLKLGGMEITNKMYQ